MHTTKTAPSPSGIDDLCAAAARDLRSIYTTTYRPALNYHTNKPNNGCNPIEEADRQACRTLRRCLQSTLNRHLGNVELGFYVDPGYWIIDSTWTTDTHTIDIYWDYHPNWQIGDPTALSVTATPLNRNNSGWDGIR